MVLNNEEFILLCLLQRRLFTPFEVVVNRYYNGSLEKARDSVDILEKRKMVEYIYDRVIITAVGKKATRNEQINRGTTAFYYNYKAFLKTNLMINRKEHLFN
jgi:hypothetical protein